MNEDVLQEVNLFIWRHGNEFQPGTNFTAWAYQIARIQVLDSRKRRRGTVQFSDAVIEQLAVSAAVLWRSAAFQLDGDCDERLWHRARHVFRKRSRHFQYAECGIGRVNGASRHPGSFCGPPPCPPPVRRLLYSLLIR